MKFKAAEFRFNPETPSGNVSAYETVTDEDGVEYVVGDTRVDFPLSKAACEKINAILAEEVEATLREIRS